MFWRTLADAIAVLHLTVVAFIVFGGLAALRWPRVAYVHVPFALWGMAIEVGRWVCPLTPLENRLRRLGGGAPYDSGFVEHYVLPVLYPEGLGPTTGLALAGLVLAVNVAVYALVGARMRRAAAARNDR